MVLDIAFKTGYMWKTAAVLKCGEEKKTSKYYDTCNKKVGEYTHFEMLVNRGIVG